MNKYREVMERLTVTDEMKARVLHHLQDGTAAAERPRVIPMKRYAAFAACIVLLVVCVVAVRALNSDRVEPIEQTPWGTVTYQNAADLEKASKLPIEDLPRLPFTPTSTVYQDYPANLAEIVYSDDTESLYYRVSKGSEDNSGDYNEYADVQTKDIHGITVTLKGDGKRIYCLLYEKGGYSYSIGSDKGLTAEQIEQMIP